MSDVTIPPDLVGHLPSLVARRRAREAGLDLDTLKRTRPDEYRILNAEAWLRVTPAFADAAVRLLPDDPARHVYSVPGERTVQLLAFPPLDPSALEAFDEAAAGLVTEPEFERDLAYYRIVNDPRGQHRELLAPIPPDAWNGEDGLVGPFATEEAAQAWPAGRLPAHLMADPLPYIGHWFCDVFDSEEAWVEAQARDG